MKHIFIINPAAGKGKAESMIQPEIEKAVKDRAVDYEIIVTKSSDNAKEICRSLAQSGEQIRMYVCGGDGTVCDVVNAIYGYENVELAIIPLGSGNDFVRFFGEKEEFCDIESQLDGTPIKIDAISCGDYIAINQCSMGFDAEVCIKQSKFKKMPIFTGETAYMAALFNCLFAKKSSHLKITIDDKDVYEGEFMFAYCGNGRFYGGGFQPGPYALPDDGYLDFSIIKNMNIPRFLSKVGEYKNGEHYTWPETTYLRGKKMKVEALKDSAVNIDGECVVAKECTFEIIENAFNFVIPKTSKYIEDRKSGKINNKIG